MTNHSMTTLPTLRVVDCKRSPDGAYVLVDQCPNCGRSHQHARHQPGNGCPYHFCEVDLPDNQCSCAVGAGDGYRVAPCKSLYIVIEVDDHA
ncbi:hypothetical protein A5791_15825 [Mycobacterium sp. 852002-51163_SCH5372311]|uniref:hypothetical protein n=1 Tax=Mycobacterium sp. 852002-51163_SCH5372311 TaxID=1834097 RepID=UPI0007FFEF5D|nr:hypothetical protein [Mycobacterium sp. 852002-51163_SCH5372311]OBF91051.1 hypothetical protein A5791_15825 [Mycobacterium sp. 852002-51163_SCH5372311]